MYTEPSLAIDMGASYTKVAYRPRLDEDAHQAPRVPRRRAFQVPTEVATFRTRRNETVMWVPSAVAHDKERDHWSFGEEAVALDGTPGVKVDINWKRQLYLAPKSERLRRVCGKFLSWVLDDAARRWELPATVRVRVAVPALEHQAEFEEAIRKSVGSFPGMISFATEPRCNAIGSFSEGRNGIHRHGGSLYVSRGRTVGGPETGGSNGELWNALRDGDGHVYRPLLLDLGAFTVDVARLELDTSEDDMPEAKVDCRSREVGLVNEVDRRVFDHIRARWGGYDARKELGLAAQEQAKFRLYAGGSLAFPGGVAMQDDQDKIVLSEILDGYVSSAWELLAPYLEEGDEQVIATGGPVGAPLIRQRLEAKAGAGGVRLYVPSGGRYWTRTSDPQLVELVL